MSVGDVLLAISEAGLTLAASETEDTLKVYPVENITPELAEAIREHKVFAISYPERASASEKALIALSYRDARDRAERAAADRGNQDALEDLLDRAEKAGDAQLAEAAYHVATVGSRAAAPARARQGLGRGRGVSYEPL